MKKIIIALLIFVSISIIMAVLSYELVRSNASNKVYNQVESIPKNKVGLVLGTSKKLRNGNTNLYFKYRIEATVQLYKARKIAFVLVSGDNSRSTYDEPTDFKNELIAQGIPADRIYLDYAGFRTLDSVVRAQAIFGQDQFTVISQQFHNERAIYLADNLGIKAIGFNAKNVSGRYGIRVMVREYLARVKLYFDILFGVQPKFLGKQIPIG